jgi:hypothetical protein
MTKLPARASIKNRRWAKPAAVLGEICTKEDLNG